MPALEEDSDAGGESPGIVEESLDNKPAINSGLLSLKQSANSRNAPEALTSLSERNAGTTEAGMTGGKPTGITLDKSFSPRLGLTVKQPRKGGGMAARRNKLNLSGVPGLSPSASKLDFIHGKANHLAAIRKEQESKCFKS